MDLQSDIDVMKGQKENSILKICYFANDKEVLLLILQEQRKLFLIGIILYNKNNYRSPFNQGSTVIRSLKLKS